VLTRHVRPTNANLISAHTSHPTNKRKLDQVKAVHQALLSSDAVTVSQRPSTLRKDATFVRAAGWNVSLSLMRRASLRCVSCAKTRCAASVQRLRVWCVTVTNVALLEPRLCLVDEQAVACERAFACACAFGVTWRPCGGGAVRGGGGGGAV